MIKKPTFTGGGPNISLSLGWFLFVPFNHFFISVPIHVYTSEWKLRVLPNKRRRYLPSVNLIVIQFLIFGFVKEKGKTKC